MSTSELQQRSPEETHQDQLYTLSLGSPNEADISASVMGGRCSPVHDPHKSCISAVGTMCAVCGDVAPGGSTYRRHYGVICCEACKCFFRRTVQMNRDYKCRYGSNCSVGRSPVNMKQVCQACRFNQCVKAGMKVDCKSCLLFVVLLFLLLFLSELQTKKTCYLLTCQNV